MDQPLSADATGRVVIVTGATGGIGLQIALGLARLGATVVVGARSPERGAAAGETIAAGAGPAGRVHVLPLDVADLRSVRAFAAEVRQRQRGGSRYPRRPRSAGVAGIGVRRRVEALPAGAGPDVPGHGREPGHVLRRGQGGDTQAMADGLTLINAGVHFAGGTLLHRAAGADGAAVLFSGDILQVVMDRAWVGFMYRYPNLIPERAATVLRALDLLEPWDFDRVYGAWWGRVVAAGGKEAVRRSAERYLRYVRGEPPPA